MNNIVYIDVICKQTIGLVLNNSEFVENIEEYSHELLKQELLKNDISLSKSNSHMYMSTRSIENDEGIEISHNHLKTDLND